MILTDGGRKKNKNKQELIGAEETKINNPEQLGLQSDVVADEVALSRVRPSPSTQLP